MVNTLKKIVLGALLAATATVFLGATDTLAADKWEEARQEMIDNYKANIEEKVAEEKAGVEALQEEYKWKIEAVKDYDTDLKVAQRYVKYVADQSRGLNVSEIKNAQSFAQSYLNNANWFYVHRMNGKNQADYNAELAKLGGKAAAPAITGIYNEDLFLKAGGIIEETKNEEAAQENACE